MNVVPRRAPVCAESLGAVLGNPPSLLRRLQPPPVCGAPSLMPLGRSGLRWHGIVVEQRTKGPGFS